MSTMNGPKMSDLELVVYYIFNIVTLGFLWIMKIVIKKAIIEGIGSMNFNFFIDTREKIIKIAKEN